MSNEELAQAIAVTNTMVKTTPPLAPPYELLKKHLADLLEAQRLRSLKDDRTRYGY